MARNTQWMVLLTLGWLGLSSPVDAQFIRGDVNEDGAVDIGDPVALLGILFTPGTPPLDCEDRGDGNDDGLLNIADAVFVLGWLFTPGSPPPPEPYPAPGGDPTADGLAGTCGVIGPPGPGDFFTIATGSTSGLPDGTFIARSANTWGMLWTQHAPGTPIPPVDFDTDIVVGVVRYFMGDEHCVEIQQLTDDGTAVLVDVEIQDALVPPCASGVGPSQVSHWVRWENATSVPNTSQVTDQHVVVCPVVCP